MSFPHEKQLSSFGEAFKNFRKGAGLSLKELGELSRIQIRYLKSLEEENFSELPPLVYTRGFIYKCSEIFARGKNLSTVSSKRRKGKSTNKNLSPEGCFNVLYGLFLARQDIYKSANFEKAKFEFDKEERGAHLYGLRLKRALPVVLIRPRNILYIATFIFLSVGFGYLVIRFVPFVFTPKVMINEPISENAIVDTRSVTFEGGTKWASSLTLNDDKVYIGENGEFRQSIGVEEGVNMMVFRVKNFFGREVEVVRRVVYIKN